MPLTAAHWFYLAGVIVILITMIARKNIVVPAVVATFLTAFVFSGSLITGITSIFNASLVAATNLFNIFLIIALVTAMLHSLQVVGADRKMVAPFRRVMRNGHMAFWGLALVTFVMALFFWPTPVVPLLGAVLIPVAIRAGMRPIAVGVVVAVAGQGMALSSDYVIRVAPGLSAEAGGLSANGVTDKALVLAIVTGGVALLLTYVLEMRKMRTPSPQLLADWEGKGQVVSIEAGGAVGSAEAGSTGAGERAGAQVRAGSAGSTGTGDDEGGGTTMLVAERPDGSDGEPDADETGSSNPKAATFFAVLVPVLYLSLIVYMIVAKVVDTVPDLEAGEAAGLVGGVAAFVVILAALVGEGRGFLESSATHVVNGLVFAFKAMGIVIPIAGFFFLGNGEFAAEILGRDDVGEGLLFDMVATLQQHVPDSPMIAAFAILLVGLVAGLDGSGFSGLPLTGALAGSFGAGSGMDPETLAALGQMGNIWAGGGTLVAWSSLIAVAGFARVSVLDLARRCFLPVMAGLFVSILVAVIFLG